MVDAPASLASLLTIFAAEDRVRVRGGCASAGGHPMAIVLPVRERV